MAMWRSKGFALRLSVMVLVPLLAACGMDGDGVAGPVDEVVSGGGTTGGGDTTGSTGGTTGGDNSGTAGSEPPPTDGGTTGGTTGGDTSGTPGSEPPPTDGTDTGTPPTEPGGVDDGSGTAAVLTISGVPDSGVKPGETYSFRPTLESTSGAAVAFSISNKPAWASFDSMTGELQGTPVIGDAGVTGDIVITATDGTLVAQLPPFSIVVDTSFVGVIALSWQPPSQNEDGTPLDDLAGYRIYYGVQPGNYTTVIDVPGADVTSYTIENLPPSTYYVAAASYDNSGLESGLSNAIERTVN